MIFVFFVFTKSSDDYKLIQSQIYVYDFITRCCCYSEHSTAKCVRPRLHRHNMRIEVFWDSVCVLLQLVIDTAGEWMDFSLKKKKKKWMKECSVFYGSSHCQLAMCLYGIPTIHSSIHSNTMHIYMTCESSNEEWRKQKKKRKRKRNVCRTTMETVVFYELWIWIRWMRVLRKPTDFEIFINFIINRVYFLKCLIFFLYTYFIWFQCIDTNRAELS